jgi:hypothetical protein
MEKTRLRTRPGHIVLTFIVVILIVTATYFSMNQLISKKDESGLQLSKLCQSLLNAPKGSVLFIHPGSDANRPEHPNAEDAALYIIAEGVMFGMTADPQLVTVDQGSYLDSVTGKPNFSGPIVVVGNSQDNAVTRYYESSGDTHFVLGQNVDSYFVKNVSGTSVASSQMSKYVLDSRVSDVFVIECFKDAVGRDVLLVWGYTGRGAMAGMFFIKFKILDKPNEYTSPYYVGIWEDASEGSSRNNIPDAGDSFQTIQEEPVSSLEPYVIGWHRIAILYVSALLLTLFWYSVQKGLIKFERSPTGNVI